MNFVVLSSSRGTAFQATLDCIADGSLTAKCIGLITDSQDRGCIEKAKSAGIPYKVIERKENDDREEYDKRLSETINELTSKPVNESPTTSPEALIENNQTVITCMGWLWIFSPWFIEQYKNRILNVHPALLPKHGGEGMYGHHVHDAVLKSGDKESGATIHLMDEGVDTGKTLLQKSCHVLPNDTAESLQEKVQKLERELFPKALQMIHTGAISLT